MTTENPIDSALDQTMQTLLSEMAGFEGHDKEYGKMVDRLQKLHVVRSERQKDRFPVSLETLITVGSNLLGILMILGYERTHILSSKALSFVVKTRV